MKDRASGLRYRPLLMLGQGGMANVLLAVGSGPSGFNKLVVLKAMRKELVAEDELRQMFLDEARLSARLNNANVVQVHEVVDAAIPCIVMEYLDGQPLSSLLSKAGEQFSLPMQLRVLSEALNGLHYSHELREYDGSPLNIVHRDVSPQNIFVTYDGVVKVLDFGIAKAVSSTSQTRTGVLKGKIAYMPPEQILCESLDRRADVYAVGCMLWHVAAGVLLWAGKAEGDVMRAVIEGVIPKPSELRPVDPRLEAIVMKALAPDPDDRFASALELQVALDEFLVDAFPGVTMRSVGELVSNLFTEHRQVRQEQIRAALESSHSSLPPAELPEGFETVVQVTPFGPSQSTAVSSGTRWLVASMVFVLVLAIGGWYFAVTSRGGSAPQPPAARPTPTEIALRIQVSPEEATLTVDGRHVEGNPARISVAPDDRTHELRVTKDGYEPYLRALRFERDLALEVNLQLLPVAAPLESSAATTGAKPNPAMRTTKPRAASATRPPTDCKPPFYFDNGFKKYKPGCI